MATGETHAPVKLSLGPLDEGILLTDEEYAGADYEAPWRYELVDGRLVVMSPNSEEHDDAAEVWRDSFVDHLAGRVLVLHHTPGASIERDLTPSDVYTTPPLPGLAIPISEVLGT